MLCREEAWSGAPTWTVRRNSKYQGNQNPGNSWGSLILYIGMLYRTLRISSVWVLVVRFQFTVEFRVREDLVSRFIVGIRGTTLSLILSP